MKYNPGKHKQDDIEGEIRGWVRREILNDPMRSSFVSSREINDNIDTGYNEEIVSHVLPHIEWLEKWSSGNSCSRYKIIPEEMDGV